MPRLPFIAKPIAVFTTVTAIALLLAAGCSSSPSRTSSSASLSSSASAEPGAIVHQVSADDLAGTHGKYALTTDTATLWVNGLSCPQCASNVDAQLLRVTGISDVKVDLSTGKIAIAMNGPKRPSPAQLSRAVEDAGFTLAKIETP